VNVVYNLIRVKEIGIAKQKAKGKRKRKRKKYGRVSIPRPRTM